MKNNYNLLLKDEIKNLKNKPTLLLHSCCAPCSSHVISYLNSYFNITVLYYNPNIFPEEEYNKRKSEQIRLLSILQNKQRIDFLDIDYNNDIFEKQIVGLENEPEGGKRCYKCIYLRLEKTAKLAIKNGFEYFCTTLTVSPHKNSQIINEIGIEIQKKYNVKWLYSDFKKEEGYKKSIILSKKYNLYRQNYCGCKYSIY